MLHLPSKSKYDNSSSNQSRSLYSYTRNSFSCSTSMTINRNRKPKQTHTKSGDVTLYGLHIGFIQASSIPDIKIIMEYMSHSELIHVHGYTRENRRIGKTFTLISFARAYLKSFT